MAIRPVDLQLAYLAGPLSAAQTSVAQQAAAGTAQQAAQAAFAAQVAQREETIEETAKEARLSADADGQGNGAYESGGQHAPPEEEPSAMASDGEHFIDVSC
jgi:hypothetical protein